MIELNNKTDQDFLSLEWCKRIVEAGIDMSDAKYRILDYGDKKYVVYNSNEGTPTYTLAELLYKLDEYPDNCENGLFFFKDAPFYGFGYNFKDKGEFVRYSEYPIEAAAMLLIASNKLEGVYHCKDISDK